MHHTREARGDTCEGDSPYPLPGAHNRFSWAPKGGCTHGERGEGQDPDGLIHSPGYSRLNCAVKGGWGGYEVWGRSNDGNLAGGGNA